jgi:hypothetical protein
MLNYVPKAVSDLSEAQIYDNTIWNCGYGVEVSATNGYPATNIDFFSNTLTVASSSNNWAFGINISALPRGFVLQ